MKNDNFLKVRQWGQAIIFLIIVSILILAIFEKIELRWEGFVGLSTLAVLLVLPSVSEISIFDLLRIRRRLDNINEKLDVIIETKSEAKAESIINLSVSGADNTQITKKERKG